MRPQALRRRAPERLRGTISEMMSWSEVAPTWKGDTAVCIGSGPSLTAEDVERVRVSGARCIAVNDAYLLAPWADICFFADFEWWQWHTGAGAHDNSMKRMGLEAHEVRERFASFAGQKCSVQLAVRADPEVHILKNAGDWGLSLQPTHIFNGRHGGYCAVNIAVLAGVRRIILLGYDARAPQGRPSHWFGEHPRPANPNAYNKYVESFERTKAAIATAGVRVINATPGSRIPSFPFMSIDAALNP